MPIYLDYHSHAPMHPTARDATFEAYERFDANPHSTHLHGAAAHDAVEKSRGQVAGLLGARPSEIVFTSGATEANNLVFAGLRDHLIGLGRTRIAVSTIEHPSVLKAAETLRRDNLEVDFLPVQPDGLIDLEAAAAAITPATGLVSVAAANHEVGVLQPLAALSEIARARGAFSTPI
ncbi:aminotransferase class V-fold PLP-dependent enzyme (plasmid) [Rhizobium sp. RCAM05350]|uniref:aminotransferase class V-fold PLP-dependent enzyme n=1 Tax=Rhizobium sp. RCAM05350 TaxID=2895568 RepID=UPI0020769827|nr:aminotransferase class V-fold PLP-dependent enzyme [Rhizobium sp. RCAM05350]URK89499.1 aminotransferase class V-fold PLP-dependent enzyme [Rhizobium sp. RCAM05350]